ncbi:nascent polypeptide-associated complex protein [Metallosphaera hakonensis]|uniref:Nascent polypeptide-associated complex protein n=1 Tax=Metallosphaera hakonensis JCM 8857 = DSM 7519 TaxID=1293036 RepID=A0A2U9IVP0_9CREN|nr:nascent polypeptide-associated complex protein [Metallosphaera hakonensis]AWS00076.1 nascent polypeptide-associated complex protein [Metallosphaera hakonensis JCM 8857 = DSM 7519]
MKVNPKDLKKLEKMGIKTQNIDALRVIIETQNERIIIESPMVTKANVMGQEAITIVGGTTKVEPKSSTTVQINEDDVRFVMDQTGKPEPEVREALKKANGDIAKAILSLTEGQGP